MSSPSSSGVPGEYPSGEMRGGGRWEEVTRDCSIPDGRSSLARERGSDGGGGVYTDGMAWLMAAVVAAEAYINQQACS